MAGTGPFWARGKLDPSSTAVDTGDNMYRESSLTLSQQSAYQGRFSVLPIPSGPSGVKSHCR